MEIKETSGFRKDVKRAIKQGKDIVRLKQVIVLLFKNTKLPEKIS
jgi:mRNA-degrading endonuclease YafQ of YafQ-DinJ toxin-antitoxin module